MLVSRGHIAFDGNSTSAAGPEPEGSTRQGSFDSLICRVSSTNRLGNSTQPKHFLSQPHSFMGPILTEEDKILPMLFVSFKLNLVSVFC